jgi:hypothetical protein
MRAVEDADGRRWLRLKRSAESSLVRDPVTGERTSLPNASLSPIEGADPLAVAADAAPAALRDRLGPLPDDRAVGLLVELGAGGPRSVRGLLDETDLCESDLHGMVGELGAAGLLEETTVAGRRGYALTEAASSALEAATETAEG